MINGAHVILGQVPALPFVSALPTSTHPNLHYAVLAWFLLFVILFLFITRGGGSLGDLTRRWIIQGIRIFIVITLITFLSQGELLRANLNPVGVIWSKFTLDLGICFVTAAILTLYLPALLRKLVHRE
jgi:hypothetical protein